MRQFLCFVLRSQSRLAAVLLKECIGSTVWLLTLHWTAGSGRFPVCQIIDRGRKKTRSMASLRLVLKLWTVGLLFFINLINYMDRLTIAGILPELQNATRNGFNETVSDLKGGLLQTGSTLSFMLFGPIFGYLGDRLTRKYIVAAGLILWSGFILAGSFSVNYAMLIVMRCLVGIGDATFSPIAPTLIADLFPPKTRIRALAVYGLAVPLGSSLGFGVGSFVSSEIYRNFQYEESWRWAFRILPGIGVLVAILVLLTVPEPPRGQTDNSRNKTGVKGKTGLKHYANDIFYLFTNKTYLITSLGYATLGFALGALGQWIPTYIYRASRLMHANGLSNSYTVSEVSIGTGIVTAVAAFVGIISGSELSKLINRKTDKADTIVCALSLIIGGPVLFVALVLGVFNFYVGWVFVFITQIFFTLLSAPIGAILLYVVVPERRAIAVAVQIMIIHLLGDAASPFVIGAISDDLRSRLNVDYDEIYSECMGLQYALYITAFVAVIGGGLYLLSTFTVLSDREAVKIHVMNTQIEQEKQRLHGSSKKEPTNKAAVKTSHDLRDEEKEDLPLLNTK